MNTTNIRNKLAKIMRYKFKILSLLIIIIMLNACSTMSYNTVDKQVNLLMTQKELNETELLNISIILFESGQLPQAKEDRLGLSEEIRNAEARFMPIHLKYTLQRTGFWGDVRVIPSQNEASEIIIKGKILNSDGENIELKIQVYNSKNKKWFEKIYRESVNINEQRITEIEKKDRFQNLYNQISNDLIIYRQRVSPSEIKRIKEVAEIRFANYMAPTIFSNYLSKDSNGIYHLRKLPASDDSMLKRVRSIQGRDEMLIDTINNYYDMYYSDMWESYDNWRKFRCEELDSIREINQKATTQKILGAVAIIGAIALGASHNSNIVNDTGVLRSIMIAGGTYAVYSGIKTSKESEINKEAMQELGSSFAIEVEPIVVDVNGKTMKLTGSADQQYEKWRRVLKQIYVNETSF